MASKEIRILLVDDFEMVRNMIRGLLNDLGFFNIEEAEDGKSALEKLRAGQSAGTPYSLIFCDWNMPEMTGIEVLESCQGDDTLKNSAFVMVTAEAEQHFVVRALRAGAADYIVKPIAPNILERKIGKILAKLGTAA